MTTLHPFLRHKKHIKTSIFQHEMPVLPGLFYDPVRQFQIKIAVSCWKSKAENDISLRRKVPKLEKKIRLTLEVPVRKVFWYRKNVFGC